MASVFCPNCGTQNESSAMPCKNCGFKLSGLSAAKFKGTMMLNSDQSVQDMIDEHKKKQQPSPAASPSGDAEPGPAANVAPSAARGPSDTRISAVPGAPRSVSEPPRAGKGRRMAGTMLGVAPQAGGITPPTPSPPTAQPPAATKPQEAAPEPPQRVEPNVKTVAGLAGTIAMPAPPAPQPRAEPAAEAFKLGTQPLAAVPAASGSAGPGAPVEPSPRPVHATVPLPLAETTAAAPAQPPSAAAVTLPEAEPPASFTEAAPFTQAPSDRALASASSGSLRPWEIFLIVATCGLYGLVLLVTRRRSPPKSSA